MRGQKCRAARLAQRPLGGGEVRTRFRADTGKFKLRFKAGEIALLALMNGRRPVDSFEVAGNFGCRKRNLSQQADPEPPAAVIRLVASYLSAANQLRVATCREVIP